VSTLSRRQVVQGAGAVGLGLLAGCGRWPGQAPPAQIARVGYLATNEEPARLDAFRQGLTELGYVVGQNLMIEARFAGGQPDRLPTVVAELVGLPVDVILVRGTVPVRTAMAATTTIPLVTVGSEDPVAFGLTASLARPGGNVTGLSSIAQQLNGKRLELLKDAVPGISRVAVLWNPANAGWQAQMLKATEVAATALRLQVQLVEARGPDELEGAFAGTARERASALLVAVDVIFALHARRIADLAAKRHLPAMYGSSEHVEAGGLISYAPDIPDVFRRAATYVDKILKGAKPSDMPVEQPTKLLLVINLKTAKALGLTIPPSLLLRADQVIE